LSLTLYFSEEEYLVGKPMVCGQRSSAFVRPLSGQFRCFKNPFGPLEMEMQFKAFPLVGHKKPPRKLKTTAGEEFTAL